jgi:type IV pilus assembly protein PilM
MSTLSDWLVLDRSTTPSSAVEISAHRVSAATIERRGDRAFVAAHAAELLPDGVVVPSLVNANVKDHSTLRGALGRVLEQIGRPRRVGLVLPDAVAKVSLLRFEQVPARSHDLDQLIRWQTRKAAPFPIEEAQVSYTPGARTLEGQEFVVLLARRSVVAEFEDACGAANAHAGIVGISTLDVINAVLAGRDAPHGDWLLVNVSSDAASIVILRDRHPMFFRSRSADDNSALADLVHQSAMYYEDRLSGSGFSRVLLAGISTAADQQAADVEYFRRTLEARLGVAVEAVDPRGAVTLTDRITAAPVLLDALAPLTGILMRDHPGGVAA